MDIIYTTIKILHVLSGGLWFGEVVLLNVLILPVLAKSDDELRKTLLVALLPRIINLASLFALVFTATAIVLVMCSSTFFTSPYLMTAVVLLSLLTIFHFFMGYRVFMRKITAGTHENIMSVYRIVQVLPRIGLLVISVIIALFMYSAPLYLLQ